MTTTTRRPQYLDALARANEVRWGAAALKRELKAGEINLAAALIDERSRSLTIYDLLRARHRWGGARSRALLRTVAIHESKPVGTLTPRQRRAIIVAGC